MPITLSRPADPIAGLEEVSAFARRVSRQRASVAALREMLGDPHAIPDSAREARDERGDLRAFVFLWRMDVGDESHVRVWLHAPSDDIVETAPPVFAHVARVAVALADATGRPTRAILSAVDETDAPRRAALASLGFVVRRYSFRMERALPPPPATPALPPGFVRRPCAGAADADEYVAMFNETWVDHLDFSPLTRESFLHDVSAPEYDPALDVVVATPEGRFAAFCYCTLDPTDPARGTLQTLGVRRGFRGRGLGAAAVAVGMEALVAKGRAIADLHVDAANPTGALGLYEKMGFTRRDTTLRYALDETGLRRLVGDQRREPHALQ